MPVKGLKLHCMDIGLRDKMGVIIINSYTGGGSAPLAASIDAGSLIDTSVNPAPATGSVTTFTSVQGDLSATVNATGGTGNYNYAWSVVRKLNENSDTGNRFSVNTTGTTNAATYNTLTIDGARGAVAGDVFDALFDINCVVTDGVDLALANIQFVVIGEPF